MSTEEIKNTEFYKSLSKLSCSDRGILFANHSAEVEKQLNVKLIKHSYMELGELTNNNPIISYQDNWGSYSGPIMAIMEFSPLN